MHIKRLAILILFLLLLGSAMAQTDKVYTKTGDVLIGELKSMQSGVLIFDTDYADSKFQIDWDEIRSIEIGDGHIIYTADGNRYRGALVPLSGDARLIRLVMSDSEITMALDEIVAIASLEKKFRDRLIISLDAGMSITKANNVRQTSASGNASYRGEKWTLSGNFSNVGTTQDNVDPIDRTEGGLAITRDIYGNSMFMGGTEFLSNSEQQLDLRSTGRAGVGYYLIRNSTMYFLAGGGLALSNEQYGGDNPTSQNSIEGVGITEFHAYNTGDLSFQAKLNTYPSISDFGRWRINADVSLKYDLPLDFYIKLSYIHNYDSDPLIDVSKSDYVFKTSLGWEWD